MLELKIRNGNQNSTSTFKTMESTSRLAATGKIHQFLFALLLPSKVLISLKLHFFYFSKVSVINLILSSLVAVHFSCNIKS